MVEVAGAFIMLSTADDFAATEHFMAIIRVSYSFAFLEPGGFLHGAVHNINALWF
jgi:hypothetical protein